MFTYFEPNSLSTNVIGRVVPLMLMVPYLLQTASIDSSHNVEMHSSAEKVTISITQSTGNLKLFQESLDKYYKVYMFAKTFLHQVTDTSPEFDEFFKENFWDLLA
jgi:hypothetical protein